MLKRKWGREKRERGESDGEECESEWEREGERNRDIDRDMDLYDREKEWRRGERE